MENTIRRRGVCLIIAAPSGAGKSTLARALLQSESELTLSISVTTRQPRPGEREGVDYYFVSEAAFETMASNGELIEWARVFGRDYGTPRSPVDAALSSGRDILFDIDWQGWRQLKTGLAEDCVGVFLLPPSLEALQRRLVGRAGDTADEIKRRMQAAQSEISHWEEFDHVLVNDELDHCLTEMRSVLHAARTATRRQLGLAQFVARLS